MKIAISLIAVIFLSACTTVQKHCNPMKEECTIGEDPAKRRDRDPTRPGGPTTPHLLERSKVGGFYI